MKKLICTALVFVMLAASLTACNIDSDKLTDSQDKSQSKNLTEKISVKAESTLFGDYDSIINCYRDIISANLNKINESDSADTALDDILSKAENETEKNWCQKIASSAFEFRPISVDEETYKNSYGHAVHDINNDGVDELILLKNDYTLLGIFTMYRDMPIMLPLDTFTPRKRAWIDENGQIYVLSSGGSTSSCISVYKIEGPTCVLVEEVGSNEGYLNGGYYKITAEDKIPTTIEKSEFDEVFNSKFFDYDVCGEHTKNNTDMEFVSLFEN